MQSPALLGDTSASASNLLAGMNHEIRTSMNGVVGMLELLLDTGLTASQQQFATVAQNSLENLLELIEGIVDLSLIESRQLALSHSAFDLRQEMRAACALQRASAFDKGLDLTVEYPPALWVRSDPARVRQLIAGLLDSIINLAGSGEVAVATHATTQADGCCHVRVSMSAADLAIPPEQLTALLDHPRCSSAHPIRGHGKTGLELALCRELAAMMGGRISITTPPQQHAAFSLILELPLQPMAAGEPGGTKLVPSDAASIQSQPGESESVPLTGRRILVVDDDPINRQIATRMLEKFGCRADVAAGGQKAIDMQLAARYDLILMDCLMPGLDGYQTTEHLRSQENGVLRTPVIALTACTAQDEREKCMAAGMDDFLAKPIRVQTLKDMLLRWLPPGPALPALTVEAIGDELEAIRQMFGADFVDLAQLYQTDSPTRLAALREAYAAGEHAQVAQVAHAFSGGSASIGAIALSALCKELEQQAKNGVLADFMKLMGMIDAEYERISDKLREMSGTH